MEKVTTVGIDLAKRVFVLHGVDAMGRVVLKKTVCREQLMELVAGLAPCRIGMEACAGAHEWARRFTELGHEVKLMAAKFVVPYRKNGKNDGNDAEAICEAVGRPNMRFVPVKSAEQQAVLALHRTCQGFVTERTAVINRIRALLTEFGVVLPQSAEVVRRQAAGGAEALPVLARRMIEDLRSHLTLLDERIAVYDREIEVLARQSEPTRRLMSIRGIGPLTAQAIVATVYLLADNLDDNTVTCSTPVPNPSFLSSPKALCLKSAHRAGDDVGPEQEYGDEEDLAEPLLGQFAADALAQDHPDAGRNHGAE
jgi:transposase